MAAATKKAAPKDVDEAPEEEPVGDLIAVAVPIYDSVKDAEKAAKAEAEEAGVEPSAVMAVSPEGAAVGDGSHYDGSHTASHGDFSKFAKAEAKRVKALD